jgi:phosphoribosyl 1,2-cyclic phosphate phosphodiesterase
MKVIVLGSGTSHGVPMLGCSCPVCTSTDPRDTRYRSSILVEGNNDERILVDAGPEFRLQGLRVGLTRLDAVLVTHAHADHIHGLDDVRPLTRGHSLQVYASTIDASEIEERFSYAFSDGQIGGGKPRLELNVVGTADISIGTMHARPIPIAHGDRPILGYRIGGLAYLTDCSAVPAASRAMLRDLDLLMVDGLRLRPHPTHFSIDEALALAMDLQPKRVLLTHICHDLSHAQIQAHCDQAGLPFEAGPAWDGLEILIP